MWASFDGRTSRVNNERRIHVPEHSASQHFGLSGQRFGDRLVAVNSDRRVVLFVYYRLYRAIFCFMATAAAAIQLETIDKKTDAKFSIS